MPTFECQCCKFSTTKKSTYDNHVKSKSHIKKTQIIQPLQKVKEEINRIEEEAEELINSQHMLEMQNKELMHEIAMLKLQLQQKDDIIKMKDEMIEVLKTQQQVTKVSYIHPTKPESRKISVKDYLTTKLNNAITIETFMNEYIQNPEYNDQFQTALFPGEEQERIILKYVKHSDYRHVSNVEYYANTLCSILTKLPVEKRPIFCSDKSRHTFYINTEANGWKILDDTKLEALFSTMAFKLTKVVLAHGSYNTKLLAKDYPAMFTAIYDFCPEKYYGDRTNSLITLLSKPLAKSEEERRFHNKINIKLAELTAKAGLTE